MKRYLFLGFALVLPHLNAEAATAKRFTTIVTVEEALAYSRDWVEQRGNSAPSAQTVEQIEKKFADCGEALGGEVRTSEDLNDFRPPVDLPEVCKAPGSDDIAHWFSQTITNTRYKKLMGKLTEKSFKWKAYLTAADDRFYDPLFNPEPMIPAQYDTLPTDEEMVAGLEGYGGPYHVAAQGVAAVKSFYSHARYKDFDKQKALLLKNAGKLAKVVLAETDITTDEGGATGRMVLLILLDKQLQAVPIQLVVVIK
jgi:hypothetical protein